MLDEQMAVVQENADEARVRALVSETPLAAREHDEAARHADAMARARDTLRTRPSSTSSTAKDELLAAVTSGKQ